MIPLQPIVLFDDPVELSVKQDSSVRASGAPSPVNENLPKHFIHQECFRWYIIFM
ncbi:hypothetical protein SAMN05216352_1384 [Alteribacillus bidgolensis]|uniref:Uncharacterized protein n=1 Tax=Alteribacillus bidgolensis TaxID=930129 RepID=A0A1G8S0G8_9BACI|nr:hypothetical protein SAMN05216352_1384 [Alteribacillus bidgolensis]